jgi:hypothetical protein
MPHALNSRCKVLLRGHTYDIIIVNTPNKWSDFTKGVDAASIHKMMNMYHVRLKVCDQAHKLLPTGARHFTRIQVRHPHYLVGGVVVIMRQICYGDANLVARRTHRLRRLDNVGFYTTVTEQVASDHQKSLRGSHDSVQMCESVVSSTCRQPTVQLRGTLGVHCERV